ncbi:MAG TPA: T9SS type A sorting domain-containing protein [Ignavibacteriaceae bacterium]
MKKATLFFLSWFAALSVFTFAQVQLKFVTINGYGNNLYIDNVTVGNQFNLDAAVGSINNINSGTSYATSTLPFVITPNVSVINIGKQNITTSFNVTMTATPGGYTSTKTITSLNSGQSTNVTFDDLTITPGQGIDISVVTNLAGDENSTNNTLNQYTIYLPGTFRNILLEEWTSSTCGPCAANNPTIDAFVAARFDSIVPIKYHMNWPSPGNDPMYLYNPTQATDRRSYYGVNAVPHVIMDGVVDPSYPYSDPTSLPGAFNPRKKVGTPIAMSVTDTRISNGDSVRADITVQVLSPLNPGSYYLRVHAVERHIKYATAPGTNGEKDFYDVFRKAYPNSLGTSVPTGVGTYNYTITYAIDKAVWVDSMIYTAAFVQNDQTKEVLNSAKGRNEVLENMIVNNQNTIIEKPVSASDFVVQSKPASVVVNTDGINSVFNYELFEGSFPANGWTLKNPDGGITFSQFTGANGPSIAGSKSVKMDFYSYSTTGASDTLISKVFNGAEVTDSVKFNYAHANYPGYTDRLVVKLSVDGGLTFPHTIFDKSGAALATVPASTNAFVPSSASQWATFSYSLESVLPVELKSFTAKVVGSSVHLNWSTATEVNNLGFEIQKKVAGEFVAVGFINGKGTTTEVQNYSYTDNNLQNGSYTYRLKQVDLTGSFEYSEEVNVDVIGPQYFSLKQNYPNPFNPSTRIEFNLASESKVTLKVFNLLGEEVVTILNGNLASGNHSVDFRAQNLNSGVYIYRLDAAGIDGSVYSDIKKMTLIK